jgi:NADH:ubiquinone oxidoreductase subunit 2 (subunit N)
MNALLAALHAAFALPGLPALIAVAAAALLVLLERRAHSWLDTLPPFLLVAVLAVLITLSAHDSLAAVPLAIAFVVAVLARDTRNSLHGECALKLLWVMGGALALSWSGLALLTIATGTPFVAEQWGVLGLGLVPRVAWSTALSLSLIVGVVMLGAAPFHSWVADMLQGTRPWLAPLGVAGLQVTGARWLALRLDGIEAFPAAAEVTGVLLAAAAAGAFVIGAATLFGQRRPERRVGTLASLQGGLLLATLVAAHGHGQPAPELEARIARWAAHLVLSLAGAATLARFMPVPARADAPGGSLFRRHPWSGLAGMFALFSLAGVPGTPGAGVWLDTARDLVAAGHTGLVVALALGWFTAFATVMQQLRDAFGVRLEAPIERSVPWEARTALWLIAAGVAALAMARVAVAG